LLQNPGDHNRTGPAQNEKQEKYSRKTVQKLTADRLSEDSVRELFIRKSFKFSCFLHINA